MIKKYLQKTFKKISYSFFLKIYGSIENSIKITDDNRINVSDIKKHKEASYKVYTIDSGRLYTDRIHDIAAILDNKIIEGPSLQFRDGPESTIQNLKADNNIVLEKGTPRKLRKLDGTVLSLLTGGAGNNNYWHWLYDVLPKLNLCTQSYSLTDIDYFLLPSNEKKFQKETLDCLNIPNHKRISSKKFRHIKAKKLIITDHPVLTTGNATKDIQNIPGWIISWLREEFTSKLKNINKNKKIYIDRYDEKSKQNFKRSIKNEEEIKAFLLKNNFIIAKLHNMSFTDQVSLFFNADCVVGLHGGGFGNIAFCQPGTKVIEFKSLTAGDVIKNLAIQVKLDYNSIDATSEGTDKYNFPTQQGSIHIPIEKLIKILGNKI